MTLSSLTPNTIYGWIGGGLLIGTVLYHKSLGTLGLVLGFGIGIYLYFVVDDQSATA
jgi:hypothetical protein